MTSRVDALFRYPIKGFSPEPVGAVQLRARDYFPGDRLFAVENGPSGFDPDKPQFISKRHFTVLAHIPEVALVRTSYDADRGLLTVAFPREGAFEADLATAEGREVFAARLGSFLGDEAKRGPLKVLSSPDRRFTDDPEGTVSILNLASVRDLEERVGKFIDPLRFRANIHVEGWPPWAELDVEKGARVRLGSAEASFLKPIVRCAATHVDPLTGVRDIDLVEALWTEYGHRFCGFYVSVMSEGRLQVGDVVERV